MHKDLTLNGLIWTCIILLSFFCLPISATTKPEVLECSLTFEISTTSLPPFNVQEGNGWIGSFAENVSKLFSQNALATKISNMYWAKALASANRGMTDAIYPALRSAEREKYLDYGTKPIGEVAISLYGNNSAQEHSVSKGNFRNKSIATLRSFEFDKSQFKGATFREVTSFEQAYDMLKKERVHYLVAVKEIIEHYNRNNLIKEIQELQMIQRQPVYVALARNSVNYPTLKACIHSD